MCLAIPGKIVEISSDNKDSALVDVVGVRRKIDLGLLQDDKPAARRLGTHSCGLRHEQDQRAGRPRPDEHAQDCWERSKARCRKFRATVWRM